MQRKPKAGAARHDIPLQKKEQIRSKQRVVENLEVPFFTIAECASYVRVNYHTMYRWIKDGLGPPATQFSDQCIRIPRDDFFNWLKQKNSGVPQHV